MKTDLFPWLSTQSTHTLALLVASLSIVVYLNGLHGELVFDDAEAIGKSRNVHMPLDVARILTDDYWGTPMASNRSHKSWRPLTVLTFRWNFVLHKLSPYGYHVVNVALHAAVSVLFFVLCMRVVFPGRRSLAAASALIFAVHPIHTEAVASIVGRAELLSARKAYSRQSYHSY